MVGHLTKLFRFLPDHQEMSKADYEPLEWTDAEVVTLKYLKARTVEQIAEQVKVLRHLLERLRAITGPR